MLKQFYSIRNNLCLSIRTYEPTIRKHTRKFQANIDPQSMPTQKRKKYNVSYMIITVRFIKISPCIVNVLILCWSQSCIIHPTNNPGYPQGWILLSECSKFWSAFKLSHFEVFLSFECLKPKFKNIHSNPALLVGHANILSMKLQNVCSM